MDNDELALLNAEDVARYLRISRAKTYNMMQTGALPTVRFGRSIRVPKKALLAWVEAGGDASATIKKR
jgi:excisionase family DNA binding protein